MSDTLFHQNFTLSDDATAIFFIGRRHPQHRVLDKRPPPDLAKAKELLTEAGYPNGFQVTMDCPNDRYVNDAAICTAVSAMLARVGVKVDVDTRTQATFFADVLSPNQTGFYLLGWAPTTYDAHTGLAINFNTRGPTGLGLANVGGYSYPRIDELTKAVGQELDQTKRNAMIDEAAKIIQDDVAILPLHQQVVVWAMKDTVDIPQPADNMLALRLVHMK
ncbi:ABC transporter substrate-binding protein [Rhizobium sp. LjRoot258]|uniref:ABC transporter substrate-binding protein n=1 Tax=Rhizobium sp. LjRoot258 TaxID=3342299 RepID=UPI003ED096F4